MPLLPLLPRLQQLSAELMDYMTLAACRLLGCGTGPHVFGSKQPPSASQFV